MPCRMPAPAVCDAVFRERRPRTMSGAAFAARPHASEVQSLLVTALQASTAALEEGVVAELFLGQIVVVVDHLVVKLARRSLCCAEDVGALIPVLEATGVIPASGRVRVSDRLINLMTRRADLDVGVGIAVRCFDDGEAPSEVAATCETDLRIVDRVWHVR